MDFLVVCNSAMDVKGIGLHAKAKHAKCRVPPIMVVEDGRAEIGFKNNAELSRLSARTGVRPGCPGPLSICLDVCGERAEHDIFNARSLVYRQVLKGNPHLIRDVTKRVIVERGRVNY